MAAISRRTWLHKAAAVAGAFRTWGNAGGGAAVARLTGPILIPGLDRPSPLYDCWIHLGDEYGTIEQYLEQMKRFRIDGGVLVQLGRSVENQPLIDLVHRYPGKFTAVCRVDVTAEHAPEALKRWVDRSGGAIVGIRINADTVSPGKDPLALWKQIHDLGLWAMLDRVHEGLATPVFQRVLRDLPKLKYSINHLGRPDTLEKPPYPEYSKILRFADRPEAVITVSSLKAWAERQNDPYPYRTVQPFIRMAWQAFGAERMTWGNGYPSDGYARTIPFMLEELSFLTPQDRARILGGTARSLWPALHAGV